ncbi:uncharacterized protein LOC134210537 [Armigeres subalbatus]|uniref:uncharacterized protein LOC134210537 n=1 Tax=Armigeres subalbatus TaxID=124917 RepID=UPI002ED525AE
MERMVNRRLTHYLESTGKLDDRQHAFRPGRGTGTYLASLGEILDEAKSQGKHAELVSLDISRAYNRAWTPGVLKKLALWGVSGNLLHFVKNFLSSLVQASDENRRVSLPVVRFFQAFSFRDSADSQPKVPVPRVKW